MQERIVAIVVLVVVLVGGSAIWWFSTRNGGNWAQEGGGAPAADVGDATAGAVQRANRGRAGSDPAAPPGPAKLVGRVLDAETGRPVDGARVRLIHGESREQRTGGSGAFDWSGLVPGSGAVIRIDANGYARF